MKIKQQKQIKAFLEKELGAKRGDALFARQDKALNELIKNTMGKSENQMKTLAQTVLPRIALYRTLQEDGFSEEDTYEYLRKYMIDMVAAKKHASTARMEDDVTYGGLKKIGFTRTKTLGYGGNCCDFHFFRK